MTAVQSDDRTLSPGASGRRTSMRALGRNTAFWVAIAELIMIAAFGIATPNNAFVRPDNLLTVGLNASQLMLLAAGMTFVLGAGQLDLSVGANVILSSVLAARVITGLAGSADQVSSGIYPNLGPALVAGVVAAVVSGAAFGAVNGLLVIRLRIDSFIVTLATSGLFLGAALVVTSGANVPDLPRDIQYTFGIGRLFGLVPYPLVVALAVGLVLWAVLRFTRFGTHTLAVGSSREAAVRAGIDVDRQVVKLFVLMGALAGCAALIDLSRFATTNVSGHQTDSLQAIAAVVIGGTSLFGGTASVPGSLLATLIPAILATGLVIMRIQAFYQLMLVGVIVLLAVYLDQRRRKWNL